MLKDFKRSFSRVRNRPRNVRNGENSVSKLKVDQRKVREGPGIWQREDREEGEG